MVYENCSELVTMLAFIGGVAIYALVGSVVAMLIADITKKSRCCDSERSFFIVIGGVFWPLAIVFGAIYVIGMFILFPFIGATKEQLRDSESRINRRIDENCSEYVDLTDDVEEYEIETPFKVGDIITGVVPQTDKNGNNISYNHLYQGCKCRVLSIKSNGSMKVILVDHKDKAAHASCIGDVFTAPARNFTLVKAPAKKRKAVKKKTKR